MANCNAFNCAQLSTMDHKLIRVAALKIIPPALKSGGR
jgi:hypothetical protein